MRREILSKMEDLRETLEAEHITKKKLRIEKLKINSELLKINRLMSSSDGWSEAEVAEFRKTSNLLTERAEEINEIHKAIDLDIKAKEQMLQNLITCFGELDGTEIFPYEVLRMVDKHSDKNWKMEWIKSPNGIVLGYAFVREDDESYGKPVVANFSIANNTIDVHNSETRKVIYANLKYDANDVMKSWDWMDFYIYAVIGMWNNDEMKKLFEDFIERDYDFAEYICSLIKEQFMKTDQEVLEEMLHR